MPHFIGSYTENQDQWIILEDLDENFAVRKHAVTLSECRSCLKWLANFHAQFINQKPDGLWEVGTYWNMSTRPEEFEKIEHAEVKAKAHIIDQILNECKYQTIVHGDAKLANFCFSENGDEVAAVDFQYVGGGCGMKDVAYLLGSCFSSEESFQHEGGLLDYYFIELKSALRILTPDVDLEAIEKEWREMYPMAIADFTRFLLGWMPSHRKVNRYHLDKLEEVLVTI